MALPMPALCIMVVLRRSVTRAIARPRCLQVIAESGSPGGGDARPYYDFLETCLRHKAEMVIFEAARAICEMRDVTSRWVQGWG